MGISTLARDELSTQPREERLPPVEIERRFFGGCNRRPEISASAQDETGVTGIGGFPALLQVQRQPAGVDQHLALLAWDVGAHVPGLRAGEQSRTDQLGDMVAPGFLRFLRRLDPAEVVTPHVLDARDDEVALQLGAGRPVAERRRALRTVDIEQIRKVRARHAQMRARAAGPQADIWSVYAAGRRIDLTFRSRVQAT